MADISQEIAAFQNAVYGEEVRGSMISLAEKINDVSEDCEATVESFEEGFDAAVATANEAATAASTAASSANTARTNANNAASSANTAATAANSAASAASATNDSVTQAEAARVTAESARVTAENARASAETDRRTAESARANAESNRASNESTRQENETTRNSAEVSRVSAEANRAAAETQRAGAESSRVSAESSRATTFRQMQDAFAEMEQQVIPPATTSTLGGIIVGEGLSVASDGTLSFQAGNFETQEHAAATYATITTVNGKANASHNHAATDIASGTLPVARGGTGVSTAAAERERLGLGSSTGALPVANGGTGSTSASDARTALDVYSTSDVDTALAGKSDTSHTHTPASLGAATQSDMDDAEQAIADVAADVATLGESVSPSSCTITVAAGLVGAKWSATGMGFVLPYPVGMHPTTVTCSSSTVNIVDLTTATNYQGIELASVALTNIGPGLAQITFTLGTNSIPLNHPVRFSGTSPVITLS